MRKVKLHLVTLFVAAAGVFTSCSDTPEQVLEKTYACLIEKDFEKMADYFVVDSLLPLNEEETKMFVTLMTANAETEFASAVQVKCEANDTTGKGEWEMNLATIGGDPVTDKGVLLKNADGDWKIAPFAGEDLSSGYDAKELMKDVRYALAKILALRGEAKYQYYMVDYSRSYYDKKAANEYLKKAAEGGYPQAQYDYAEQLRENGDNTAAFEWMKKAADQKYEDAQKQIAYYYCNGWGTERDYDKSRAICEEFAQKGDADMQHSLAWHYYGYKGLQITEYSTAEEKAIEWYKKSAEQGNAEAQYQLGFIYYNNKKNYVEAFDWYTLAAEQGHSSAQNNLGVMYDKGQGVQRDWQAALRWFKKAADQGNTLAERNYNILSRR